MLWPVTRRVCVSAAALPTPTYIPADSLRMMMNPAYGSSLRSDQGNSLRGPAPTGNNSVFGAPPSAANTWEQDAKPPVSSVVGHQSRQDLMYTSIEEEALAPSVYSPPPPSGSSRPSRQPGIVRQHSGIPVGFYNDEDATEQPRSTGGVIKSLFQGVVHALQISSPRDESSAGDEEAGHATASTTSSGKKKGKKSSKARADGNCSPTAFATGRTDRLPWAFMTLYAGEEGGPAAAAG